MFSWTIDGREYLAPSGFGEITIERFATYMATVPDMTAPNRKPQPGKSKGFMAWLTRRINKANEEMKDKSMNENEQWLREYQAKAEFVAYWLKCHDVIDMIDPSTVMQIWQFINQQWSAWKPDNVIAFEHNGLTWEVDYSFETLATVGSFADLQVVMSRICRTKAGQKASPREWGSLRLSIAASIMARIAKQYAPYGTIIGASILDHFKIK